MGATAGRPGILMTRWVLLADVHANREALEAVLEHLADWPDAAVLCAGDVVGYGADPETCIELLQARRALCVAGNHEAKSCEAAKQQAGDSRTGKRP